MLHFRENQIIAGKYRLERQLARGGMGAVWTARNLQLDIPVAVKFMAPEAIGSAELVARFEREARAAAQLRSPHVVHIYEHGVVQDTPFMVMELLEGEDLSKRLRTRGRLSIAETARIVVQVCKALRRAHEQNIVHRDLKPGNVFLCRQDEDEIVKVLDFGIAKNLTPGPEEEVTKTGAIVGTPQYMSPEQARRSQKDVDHRTDLWALGVMTFRALTGRLPFAGETQIDVLLRVCNENEPVPTASSVASDLGPEVDRFFARALARRPEGRFQSAREMAEAMSALMSAGSGAAHPLGRSWAEAEPPPPMTRIAAGTSPVRSPLPAQAAQIVPHPAARNVHMTEAKVYTAAAPPSGPASPPPAVDTHDPLGIAATIPIARSAVGQAMLRAAPGAGLTQPLGAPQSPRAPDPRAPLPSRPDGSGGWPALPPAPAPQVHSAQIAQASGDVPGTITSATTETVPMGAQHSRSSWIIWIAAAAALLVVGVVSWAVLMGVQQAGAEAADALPTIPLPTPPAPEPSASASASTSASATTAPPAPASGPVTPVMPPVMPAIAPRPSGSAPAKPATPAPKSSSTPAPAGAKDKSDSGLMTGPKF